MPTGGRVKGTQNDAPTKHPRMFAQRMEVPSQNTTEVSNVIPEELQETDNIAPQGSTEGDNIVPEKLEGRPVFYAGVPTQHRTKGNIPGKLEGTDNISPDKLAVSMHKKDLEKL